LIQFVERLRDEYTKSLQAINPHTTEYVERLRDETLLLSLTMEVRQYFIRTEDTELACRLTLLYCEHMYYKHDSIAQAMHKADCHKKQFGNWNDLHPACLGDNAKESASFDAMTTHPASVCGKPVVESYEELDTTKLMEDTCLYIYQNGDERTKIRAMLCHISHHALHDRFFQARDLLLMSHLQDTVTNTDVSTQILFNRMMALLGLCAFRLGMIPEAHNCLSELCSVGARNKELLAQGMQNSRFSDKNPAQEKAERRRQTPYHMHINLDLLECCHLTSAMLLDVRNMANEAVAGTKQGGKVVSKSFRRFMEYYDRQVFTGPPENTRDYVTAAAKALMAGNHQKACDLILNLDVWKLVPSGETVKAMLKEKIQVEALRTYMLMYSNHYEAMSLKLLCAMFGMEKSKVHSVVSKMLINKELQAAWDEPTETIVLHKVVPSQLQSLALQYAEKAANFVESNERLLDSRTGGYGYKDDWPKQNNRSWSNNDGWRGGQRGWNDQRGGGNWQGKGGRGGFRGGKGGGRGGGKGRFNDRRGGGGRYGGGGGGGGKGYNRW